MGQELPSTPGADRPAGATDAVTRQVAICNAAGLHARPCHAIASTALGFQSDLEVACEGRRANGKSILELMTLDASRGKVLEFTARGPDARDLLEALGRLVASGFGEAG